MLGEFSMRYRDRCIVCGKHQSRKIWTLFGYLLTFRSREIHQAELMHLLWAGADIDHPANTLKTLLHRARKTVGQLGYANGRDILLYRGGLYAWNPEIAVDIDIDRFIQALRTTAATRTSTGRLTHMLQALRIYTGDFLPQCAADRWADPIRTHFHTQYRQLACQTATLLEAEGRYADMLQVSQDALAIAPEDQQLHHAVIRALAAMGAQQAALTQYDRIAGPLFCRSGSIPSPEFVALYLRLIRGNRHMTQTLDDIRAQLLDTSANGALLCRYETFLDICRLLSHTAASHGQAPLLALFSPQPAGSGSISDETLLHHIRDQLRCGDVLTRYGPADFLLLLPATERESGEALLRRLVAHLRRSLPGLRLNPCYSLIPLAAN